MERRKVFILHRPNYTLIRFWYDNLLLVSDIRTQPPLLIPPTHHPGPYYVCFVNVITYRFYYHQL